MKYKVAILPGDGIGPEVINEGVKLLKTISACSDVQFEFDFLEIGGASIDAFGAPVTDETISKCGLADAILFGAIGDPKYDNNPNLSIRPEQGLLRLRKALGLFANIRPIVAYESLLEKSPLKNDRIQGVDILMFRELTSGIYFGEKGTDPIAKTAFDVCFYQEDEIERLLKLAFEAALKRNKKLTVVDKANVMETSRLWRKVAQSMSHAYPEVALDFLFVDNAAMQLVLNPKQFDVIATSNMFGDILSDEASVIAGSLGLLPSASIGEGVGLFEPIHGSFPQAKGLNIANPLGTILSVAMMLEHLKLSKLAQAIELAVSSSLENHITTTDLGGERSTSEVGSFICQQVSSQLIVEKEKEEASYPSHRN